MSMALDIREISGREAGAANTTGPIKMKEGGGVTGDGVNLRRGHHIITLWEGIHAHDL